MDTSGAIAQGTWIFGRSEEFGFPTLQDVRKRTMMTTAIMAMILAGVDEIKLKWTTPRSR